MQSTSNHSTINVETKNNRANKMKTLPSIHIDFLLHDITLTGYYNAKNICRAQVITVKQMWKKKQQSKQNDNFAFNTHTFYTTLNDTYHLLQCKEHMQITSNHSTINVGKKTIE